MSIPPRHTAVGGWGNAPPDPTQPHDWLAVDDAAPPDTAGQVADVLARLRLRACLTERSAAEQARGASRGIHGGLGDRTGRMGWRGLLGRLAWRVSPRAAVAAIAVLGVVVAVVCVRLALFPDGGPPGEAGDGDLAPDSGIVIEDLEPGADGLAPVAGPGEEDVGGGESGGGGTAIVHVAGAVAHPGIVEVPSDARVHDAVTAAGGALAQADLEAVNLARAVVDGERIYIPLPGQTPPDVLDTGPSSGAGGEPGGGGSGGGSGDALVDVNTADAAALDSLPGIGPVLAGRIVAYRDKNGPFADVEALTDVPGIGPAILENVRDLVRVG